MIPFKFCKIGLKDTLFIFGRKNGRLLFCLLFVTTLSDFGLLFKKIEAFVELRKMLSQTVHGIIFSLKFQGKNYTMLVWELLNP